MSEATATDRANSWRLILWSAAFGVFYVLASWQLKAEQPPSDVVAWALVGTSTAIGIGAIASYRRFLRATDELVRRIQLEGLAVGFGVALAFALVYPLADLAGAPTIDLVDSSVITTGAYIAGVLLASRKYR